MFGSPEQQPTKQMHRLAVLNMSTLDGELARPQTPRSANKFLTPAASDTAPRAPSSKRSERRTGERVASKLPGIMAPSGPQKLRFEFD
ncbi:hypothetical protein KFE25_009380 [Diacronema lutheri]|uniref:Uncharacterized protein n=1 Tax=Diacronema lutheri TaxID=2081491 RepID=A0A8J5Y527_DIALT|nr:hypothetical protein KFE25_009380 [Diacronema lutheri]